MKIADTLATTAFPRLHMTSSPLKLHPNYEDQSYIAAHGS
jgi:hypothetical protein